MIERDRSILVETAGPLAILRLNRPSALNAVSSEMAAELLQAIRSVSETQTVRALMIAGNGRAFCAGGDIAQFAPGRDWKKVATETMNSFHPAILALANLPIPTIAAVHGAVAGAGFSLMLACDFAIAADTTRLSLAYSKIGGTLDGSATWSLPRIVGIRKAKELAMLSDVIDAATALQLSLVNRVVPADDLRRLSEAFSAELANGPTQAFSQIKKLLDQSISTGLAEQLDLEQEAFASISSTSDFNEGISAFFEKRPPIFRGE